MISVTDLKSGTIFEDQGQVFAVLSYEHIKMGRGSANIKVKVRNVRSGATTEKSFINGAKVQNLQINKKQLQYLYKDDSFAYFMDPLSFEQAQVPLKIMGGDHKFLKEGESFYVAYLSDEPLSLELPPKMEFEITDTGPNIKGNSASNIYKDATLENNIVTKVPLFLKVGDKVRIDTRTGAYSEKV